ncbi:hypothetical protein B0T11DRAFT_347772 [Plectosphaerella cucumerina]|uniref:Uncharacterized protein n=1 Tax=Plectosphaerella cucumerina TaxID=40658 RepID=A0A8K0TWN4_9PEZI|nr:hypothetical protein B0T11DRAFT_347772 [Plectosphaerella cucumerina]
MPFPPPLFPLSLPRPPLSLSPSSLSGLYTTLCDHPWSRHRLRRTLAASSGLDPGSQVSIARSHICTLVKGAKPIPPVSLDLPALPLPLPPSPGPGSEAKRTKDSRDLSGAKESARGSAGSPQRMDGDGQMEDDNRRRHRVASESSAMGPSSGSHSTNLNMSSAGRLVDGPPPGSSSLFSATRQAFMPMDMASDGDGTGAGAEAGSGSSSRRTPGTDMGTLDTRQTHRPRHRTSTFIDTVLDTTAPQQQQHQQRRQQQHQRSPDDPSPGLRSPRRHARTDLPSPPPQNDAHLPPSISSRKPFWPSSGGSAYSYNPDPPDLPDGHDSQALLSASASSSSGHLRTALPAPAEESVGAMQPARKKTKIGRVQVAAACLGCRRRKVKSVDAPPLIQSPWLGVLSMSEMSGGTRGRFSAAGPRASAARGRGLSANTTPTSIVELKTEVEDLRDLFALLQTRLNADALEIFRRIRSSPAGDVRAVVDFVRSGDLLLQSTALGASAGLDDPKPGTSTSAPRSDGLVSELDVFHRPNARREPGGRKDIRDVLGVLMSASVMSSMSQIQGSLESVERQVTATEAVTMSINQMLTDVLKLSMASHVESNPRQVHVETSLQDAVPGGSEETDA